MATYTFTDQVGGNNGNNLSDPDNWSNDILPGPADIAIIDSNGIVPAGQALSIYGSLTAAEVDFVNLIEITTASINVSNELSVAGFTHFENGSISVNTGANPGNFDVGGSNGPGEFVQDNGSVTVNTGLLVGYSTNGTYGLRGGTVSAAYEVIAGIGSGAFTQSGGSNSVSGALTLGQGGGLSVGNSGAYTLAAGSLSAGLETVGDATAADISQSGGSNSVAGSLTLGNQQGSSGAYYLTGGALSVGGNEVIAFSGIGHFDQGGGDNAIHGVVVLGVNQGSSGNYVLHDGATLESGFLSVGVDGSGELSIQNAGATISGHVNIGVQSDAHGAVEVIGGGLGATGSGDAGTINVGIGGAGSLSVQSGGIVSTNFLNVGVNATGHGTLDVQGIGSLVQVANNVVLGNAGTASVQVQDGAHVSADRILLATQAGDFQTQTGSLAAMQISGAGTLVGASYDQLTTPDAFFNAAVVVAATGAAELAISDQAALTAGPIVIGGNAGAEGQVSASSGADIESADLVVGQEGAGRMAISGSGTIVHATGPLASPYVGVVVGLDGSGAVSVSAGALLHSDTGILLGVNAGSTGSITVDGGTVSTNVITVGEFGSAIFTLVSGEIDAIDERVGGVASEIVQSGGTQNIAGSLYLQSAGGGYVLENNAALTLHNDLFIYDGSLSGNGLVSISDGIVVLLGGVVEAQGGTLQIDNTIEADSGKLLIDSNSTLEFSGQRIGTNVDIEATAGSQNTVFQLDHFSTVMADLGGGVIAADSIINNGSIEVGSGGHLTMRGVISGSGSLVMDQNTVIELDHAALAGTGDVLFQGTASGLSILQIDNDLSPDPIVNGLPVINGNDTLVGFTTDDIIDLRFLNNGTATLLSGGPHQNVVEVDGSNGASFLQFDLLANFSGLEFATRSDGFGGTDVFLKLAPPPPPPPAPQPDIALVDDEKNSIVTKDAAHGVLANDSGAASVTGVAFDSTNDAINPGEQVSIAGKYGNLTLSSDGSYSYTVDTNGKVPDHGVAEDSFTYTVSNGHGSTAQSSLTVAIVEENDSRNYQMGASGQTLTGGNGPQILDGSAGNQTVNGGNGPDVIVGGAHDILNGGNGADTIIAAANDLLNGGKGPDTFVFAPNFGQNTIQGFDAKHDYIEFDHSVFSDVAAILEHASNDSHGNVVITDPHNSADTVTINHVATANLDPHHFLIV